MDPGAVTITPMTTTYVTRWARAAIESPDIGLGGRRVALGYLLLALEQEHQGEPTDARGRAHVTISKRGLARSLHMSNQAAMHGRSELLDAGWLTVANSTCETRSWCKPMRVILTIPSAAEIPAEANSATMMGLWEGNPVSPEVQKSTTAIRYPFGWHQRGNIDGYEGPSHLDYPEEELEEG